ncbi:ras-related protein Rab-7b [Pseudophryne corroboree]|uniref:ras-related protein Rab-7b n=1 Tax=Pseudophryne corroboree TaxID=495146 RepID=UPI0030815E8B
MHFMHCDQKVDLKMNIIGPLGTGKTSLLNQYVHKWFRNDYRNTLGAHILSKTIHVDHKSLKLQIWDTGGQERFRSLVSSFYKGSDGCLLVFDVTDMESFACLETWRNDFIDKIQSPVISFPMITLGNKIDLKERQVSEESAISWCKERKMQYFEVSAKDNINVDLAFETLAKKALMHYQECRESCLTDSIKLSPIEDSPSSSCC